MTGTRPNPLAFLDDELAALRERHLYRPLRVMSSAQGPIVSVDERRVISLSSNDYLGLTHHPRMRRAAIEAVQPFGAGAGAVRTIAGTMTLHEALEAELAEFKHTEAVLTLQSGFTANTGVIPTITGETDLIVSRRAQPRLDHRWHAAVQGAAQGLPTRRRRRAPRRPARGAGDGSRRPWRAVPADPRRDRRGVQHGRRHRAAARDRRCGGGLRSGRDGRRRPRIGRAGQGRARVGEPLRARGPGRDPGRARCRRRSGSLGGYVAGSQSLRDILIQRARPFLFSTSQPPAVAAACREAIRIMVEEPELIERLWANTRRFKAELGRLGFDIGTSETPITPVMLGDPETDDPVLAAGCSRRACSPRRSCSRPSRIDKARIRTIVTAAHTDEHAGPGA